jgi:glycogen(starch) synthase
MTQHRDVLYCEGPGDIVAAYASWKRGIDHLSETSLTYSGQFFEYCRLEKLTFHAVSYCDRAETVVDETCTVSNLPRQKLRIPKIGYELTVFLYALRLLMLALRERPKTIYIDSGVTDWAYLALLWLSGAKIVVILHNTVWPEGFRPTGIGAKLRRPVFRFVWQHCIWHTLAVSAACGRQVAAIAGNVPVTVFKASYPVASFQEAPVPKDHASGPFRVMFAGRVEENKGVFDILMMAEKLPHIEFTLCGDGYALDEVRRQAGSNVTITGRLNRAELVARYLETHIVIVPTRSTFAEGFAKVAAEAILLLRPVVTSPVVPASETLAGAIMLARTDDARSYAELIGEIQMDEQLYLRLVANARSLRPSILDDSTAFLAVLRATTHGRVGYQMTKRAHDLPPRHEDPAGLAHVGRAGMGARTPGQVEGYRQRAGEVPSD